MNRRPDDDVRHDAVLQDPADRAFAAQLAERLRASESPDYVLSARLSAARARAVASAGRRTPLQTAGRHLTSRGLGLAGAVASLALALVIALDAAPWRGQPAAPDTVRADALELMLDEHDPEFYEDLELYQWLDGQHA